MLRSLLGKVARKTPILRRFVKAPAGACAQAAPAADAGFGAPPAPARQVPIEAAPPAPVVEAAPAPAPVVEAAPAPAPVVEAAPAPAPVVEAEATAAEATATKAAEKKAAGKKAPAKKAAGKKAAAEPVAAEPVAAAPAAAEPAAEDHPDRKTEGGRKDDEVEALRAEAERKKAEIRARKEAEKAAAAAPKKVTGIAALIAQGGGTAPSAATPAVKAVSGVEWVRDATLRAADDGTAFWGVVDNESARAKARGDTLIIDQWECINCGTCVENTDMVFVLPNDAKAVVISQEGPMDLIQDAIDACPVTCIHWTDDPHRFEQINDADGNPLH